MSHSRGSAPRALVVRLTVPASGTLSGVAADVAARVAEYLGTQAPAAAALTAAMEAVASRVAPDSGEAEITFDFCKADGDLLIEARCAGRLSEVRWPTPA